MLKKGQIVYIQNEKNVVINMVEYKEDTWVWQEYEIVNKQNGAHRWLCVEPDENNKVEYYIYRPYKGIHLNGETEFMDNGKKYKLFETGTARVKSYFGNADVDMNEKCQFFDYMCDTDKSIISIEKWYGETEVSIGNKIPDADVRISEEFEVVRSAGSGAASKLALSVIIAIFAIPVILVVMALAVGSNKSISKYLKNNTSKYEYVTSVTNNENNKKAQVYKSKLSTLDATVKDIIDGVPEGITKTTDVETGTDNDGIGLETSKEYAYVYKEGSTIYVQVSEKAYVESDGKMYHSSHGSYYKRTYRSTSTSSTYSAYAASARQSSVSSRKSSGGGTSSGK